jgi:hypothetical protein
MSVSLRFSTVIVAFVAGPRSRKLPTRGAGEEAHPDMTAEANITIKLDLHLR